MISPPLKVCYVSPNAHLGGAERIIEILLKYHDRKKVVPTAVFLKNGPLVSKWQSLGVQTFVTPEFRLRSPAALKKASSEFKAFAQEKQFDVVHSHLSYGHLFSTLALRGVRARRVWFQHGPVGKGLDSIAGFLPADAIFFNSNYTRAQQFAGGSQVSHVVYGPVERPAPVGVRLQLRHEMRTRFGFNDNDTVLLHVGRMDPWKGQEFLLRAFAKIHKRHSNVKLIFFGDTSIGSEDYARSLLRQTSDLNLNSRVYFAGFETDLEKIYSVGDIFVHAANIPEPLGLSVLEAQIRSLPVVAVNSGGTAEIVINGVNGLVYEQKNEAALIESILKFVNSRQLRAQISNGSSESAFKLEAKKWTEGIENFYSMLI